MISQHIEPNIRKKAAVVGVGRMGEAIVYAMNKLGFYVVGLDTNESSKDSFSKYIKSGTDGIFYTLRDDQGAESKDLDDALIFEKPDIVISSLPYHQTEKVAYWCIDNGIRDCDLGGKVDVSKRINEYAKDAKAPVMTDLGLAPGLVNILTEQGCREIHNTPDEIKMMVGGLPGIPDSPPFNYSTTWSIDGLINEYTDDCEVLVDGEIKKVPGMSGLEEVKINILRDSFETFYTSGGASHTIADMKERGVKNCSYKTLRWQGHCDAVNFLLRKCNLSKDCLIQILKNGCAYEAGSPDFVIIKVVIKAGDVSWDKEIIIPYDLTFSAMQKATAFSVASIAAQLAEGTLEGRMEQRRGYWLDFPKTLSYKHVNYDELKNSLKELEIIL